jgi:micrococcal nuclease
MDTDRYQRLVSVIMLGDLNVNAEQVRNGWAWAYRQYLSGPYASEYIALENEARKARRGLWKQSNPQPPWEFRHSL